MVPARVLTERLQRLLAARTRRACARRLLRLAFSTFAAATWPSRKLQVRELRKVRWKVAEDWAAWRLRHEQEALLLVVFCRWAATRRRDLALRICPPPGLAGSRVFQ